MAFRGRFTTFFEGGYGRLKAALGRGRWIPDQVGDDMSRSSPEMGDGSSELGKGMDSLFRGNDRLEEG